MSRIVFSPRLNSNALNNTGGTALLCGLLGLSTFACGEGGEPNRVPSMVTAQASDTNATDVEPVPSDTGVTPGMTSLPPSTSVDPASTTVAPEATDSVNPTATVAPAASTADPVDPAGILVNPQPTTTAPTASTTPDVSPAPTTDTSADTSADPTDTTMAVDTTAATDTSTPNNTTFGVNPVNPGVDTTADSTAAVDTTETVDTTSEPADTTAAMPGEPSAPDPSPGCSGGNANASIPNSLVDKPNGYDGSTPMPLVIALHANGNGNNQLQGYFGNEGKSRGYLLVYPKSASNNWSYPGDLGRIDAAYDGMLDNYCVDKNRVFGIGHSGGAQTLTQMLCAGDDRFRAVAPVASSKYCNGWDAIPAIVIHGICDQERGAASQNPACSGTFTDKYRTMDVDGAVDFGVHKSSNMCSDEATPFTPGGNCGGNIDPGCVEYEGCTARTQFCNHNDPEYNGTNHGVPCFASQAVFDFFDAEN